MALEIFIENVKIPYSDDVSISLHFKNPLFSEKRINEVYSFSFSLPNSPELRSLTKSSKRIDSVRNIFELSGKIKMSGVSIINGIIKIKQTSNDFFSCQITSHGKNLFDLTKNKHIRDFDYGEIELWLESEEQDPFFSLADMRDRWRSLLGETNDADPETGKFKFPLIKAYYDHPETKEQDIIDNARNFYFYKGGSINQGFWDPENPQEPGKGIDEHEKPIDDTSPTPRKTDEWMHTYSPCLRVEYMLDVITDQLGITINENNVSKIQEFKRLTNFNQYVCDDRTNDLEEANFTFQNHGRKYELKDFAPNVDTWEIFRLLQELFSCYFNLNEFNQLDIYLSRDTINQNALDLTDKANPENITNTPDKNTVNRTYRYDIDEETKEIINDEYAPLTIDVENIRSWMYSPINEKESLEEGDDYKIRHLPLQTKLAKPGFNGFMNIYISRLKKEWTSECSGYNANAYLSWAYLKPIEGWHKGNRYLDKKNQLMISSRIYPENPIAERFNLILFHGRAISKKKETGIFCMCDTLKCERC